jgi:hypothetical protein
MNYLVILMHYNVRGDINESLHSNWGRSHDAGYNRQYTATKLTLHELISRNQNATSIVDIRRD